MFAKLWFPLVNLCNIFLAKMLQPFYVVYLFFFFKTHSEHWNDPRWAAETESERLHCRRDTAKKEHAYSHEVTVNANLYHSKEIGEYGCRKGG